MQEGGLAGISEGVQPGLRSGPCQRGEIHLRRHILLPDSLQRPVGLQVGGEGGEGSSEPLCC